jgi:hypothetical protein
MRYILSEKTSDLLRRVAKINNDDPDTLVRMWCMIALPDEVACPKT